MKMKNLLLSVSMFFGCMSVYAQPTLNAGSAPVLGDVFTYYVANTAGVTTGTSGASQVWDFTQLSVTTNTKKESYVTPVSLDSIAKGSSSQNAGIICSNYFKNASMASIDGLIYYYSLSNNQFINWGYVTPGQIIRPYSEPQTVITYPFTYNSVVNDTYYAMYQSSWGSGTEKGVSSTVGDGYGTLKLPTQTYNNVLRIKYTEVFKDSDNTGTVSPIYDFVVYSWYDGVRKQPLLRIEEDKKTGKIVSVLVYASGPMVSTESNIASENHLSVYPVPSKTKSTLSFAVNTTSDISISVSNMFGMKVKEINRNKVQAGNYSEEIDISNLSSGIYIVNYTVNGITSQRKLAVEK